ncbi:MAG: hypothetical protein WEC59_07265 [Salibacteraceae bacterium]
MSHNELNAFLNAFNQPSNMDDQAWEYVLNQARKVWYAHLNGENWSEQLNITCKESYLMLVSKEGKLIVENESLLNYVNNQEVDHWKRHLENLAFSAISQKRFDKADRFFTKALKVDGSRAINYYRRGLVRSRLLKNKEALEDFTKAISLNDNVAAFYLKRAAIYRLLDLDYKAMSDFNRAIKLDSQNPESYELRGKFRLSLGDKAGGGLDLQRSMELKENGKTSGKELYGKIAA